MSKLFKLKEWLTIPETAKYLSVVLGEEVTEADVLLFALDGHLQISVNFVNPVVATSEQTVIWAETGWHIDVPLKFQNDMKKIQEFVDSMPVPLAVESWCVLEGYKEKKGVRQWSVPGNRTLTLPDLSAVCQSNYGVSRNQKVNDKLVSIGGIWDLPLIGEERFSVETTYHNLTDGIAPNPKGISGAFVRGADHQTYKVLERVGTRIGLPEDSVLVVRTEALRDFEQYVASLDDNNTENDKDNISKPESTRKTDNLLRALTSIAIDDYGYDPGSSKSTAPQDIANAMSNQGISFDAKTIRNWLKEGAALLPPKREED